MLFFIVWSFISAPGHSQPDEKYAFSKRNEKSLNEPDKKIKEFLDFDDKENEILSNKETQPPVSTSTNAAKTSSKKRENFLNGVRYVLPD